jgi:hypothetical protein
MYRSFLSIQFCSHKIHQNSHISSSNEEIYSLLFLSKYFLYRKEWAEICKELIDLKGKKLLLPIKFR